MRFGTDGVRGEANVELTPEVALALGRAAALVLADDSWFIGWDTRASSTMLAAAFGAGVASAGKDMIELGEIPTAGVALVSRNRASPGAMVTASHNPFFDNGIKIFGPGGSKLADELEQSIEEKFQKIQEGGALLLSPRKVGLVVRRAPRKLLMEYRAWLTERAGAIDAGHLKIGLDCANGAGYRIGPEAIRATGANVVPTGHKPNGTNINEGCGSTDLAGLKDLVRDQRLDFGLAFDGDADRLLVVDEEGVKVDGDQIIAILARHRAGMGRLVGDGVVVSEWSNLGLLKSLRSAGIAVKVCEVGDKAVARAMALTGFQLGGEQSGHIILKDLLPAGDGISTALELISAAVDARLSMKELALGAMEKLPQGMQNVPVMLPPKQVVGELADDVRAENERLGGGGRLVLRASGTESIVRVMAEANDPSLVIELISRLAERVTSVGGVPINQRGGPVGASRAVVDSE